MDWMLSPELWIAFGTLLLLEIVLGIDNVVFISILASRLPAHQQQRARVVGLSLAMITRLLLLASLSWVIGLTAPLFTALGQEISGRDLILLLGGLFLLGKATYEIHEQLEDNEHGTTRKAVSFASVIVQILVLDVVFSLDSVITAVGMVDELGIMIAAVVVAMIIMLVSAKAISEFVNRHPTVKMLALSFLLLIGRQPDRRRLRPAHPQGLRLRPDRVLHLRRVPQPPRPRQAHEPTRAPAPHLHQERRADTRGLSHQPTIPLHPRSPTPIHANWHRISRRCRARHRRVSLPAPAPSSRSNPRAVGRS